MSSDNSKPMLKCLNDTATREDTLGVKPYVEAIAEFLTSEDTLPPITLSIEGQWGCGKSSFMLQLEKMIKLRNLSEVKTWIFLKYLFSKNEENISTELSTFIDIFTESLTLRNKNLYSFANKLKAIILYIESKIKRNKPSTKFLLSKIKIWIFLRYLLSKSEMKTSPELNYLIRILMELSVKSSEENTQNLYSFTNKLKAIGLYFYSKIGRRKYFTVWFNSWRYDKEDELWAAYAINLMNQLSQQLSFMQRLVARFNLTILRLKFKWKGKSSFSLNVTIILISTYILYVYSIPMILKILSSHSIDGSLIGIISPILPVLYLGKDLISAIINPFDFSKIVSTPNYEEHISLIEQFHSDFSKIIESYAGNSRIYVFVDDLDRCEIPKAAELMQALNLMISDEANIYFCIGMDRKIISAGLAAKNEKVIDQLRIDGLEYGYEFIEKFIQLPFKVPIPKSYDFLRFLTSLDNKENSELVQDESKRNEADESQSDELYSKPLQGEDIDTEMKSADYLNTEAGSNNKEIHNDKDCKEDTKISKQILEMVAPALDNNPRRIKQFINQFRFQKIIGYKTGLFTYNEGTAPENMWNCKKLAKFVAISIKWNSLISALNSDRMLLDQLQEYVVKPEDEHKKLENWSKDEKLVDLLRYGCMKPVNAPENVAEYTLSGLDFSKLLQISPVVAYPEVANFVGADFKRTNLQWAKIKNSLVIPIMFTEEMNRDISHTMYESFVRSDKELNKGSKLLKKIPALRFQDYVISLNIYNPRNSHDPEDWILAWDELLKEWDNGIDKKLMGKTLSNEACCYHICLRVVLPLAFALGASVNLRRSLVLYHHQSFDNKFFKVLDLKDPREVIYERDANVPVVPPKTIPENLNLDGGKKLILHIIISARHIENFQLHEDHLNATNVAIVYGTDLDPTDDWLPYVQEIVQIAKPLIHRYEDVDICLICPSVIAFALGMAFSRKGSMRVCHYFSDGKYRPVLPLSKIESHLPFS